MKQNRNRKLIQMLLNRDIDVEQTQHVCGLNAAELQDYCGTSEIAVSLRYCSVNDTDEHYWMLHYCNEATALALHVWCKPDIHMKYDDDDIVAWIID